MENKSFKERFLDLTTELQVGKNSKNTFANFNYRTKPAILEAVKPIARKYGIIITTSSEAIYVGEKHFIESTALATDLYSNESISAKAQAELQPKAGTKMSEPQLTGSSDSYAGKYALGNLLGIDDNEDPDSLTISVGENEKKKTTPNEEVQTEQKLRQDIVLIKPDELSVEKANELQQRVFDLKDEQFAGKMLTTKCKVAGRVFNETTNKWE